MKRLILIAVSGVLSVSLGSGCGSTSSAGGGLASPSQAATYNGFILGRVKLLPELQAGPVQVLSQSGDLLHQATADANGFFYYRGTLPADFQLRAVRGGDAYESEYHGGWSGGTLYINAGTTLATAYHRIHPDQTLAQAEDFVRRVYSLPSDFPMSWVSTVRSSFPDNKFFAEVRSAGSLNNYINFTWRNSVPGLAGQTGQTLLELAYQGIFTATNSSAMGNACFRMDQNTSSEEVLSDVQSKLTTVIDQVNAALGILGSPPGLTNWIRSVSLVTEEVGEIRRTIGDFKNRKQGSNYNVPDNYSLDPEQLDTLQDFQLSDFTNVIGGPITDIRSTGAYQTIVTGQMVPLGTDSTDYNSYTWRLNQFTLEQQRFFRLATEALEEAGYLEAEATNMVSPDQLAAALTALPAKLNDIAYNNQLAIQQVPDLLTLDESLVDATNGTMWFRVMTGEVSQDYALDFVDNLRLGPYSDWDVPTQSVLDNLVKTRTGPLLYPTIDTSNSTWGDIDFGGWKRVFTEMFFDTTTYAPEYNGNAVGDPSSDNEGAWCYTDDRHNLRLYEWNGTKSNPSTSYPPTGGVTTNLICCRPYADLKEANYAQVPLPFTANSSGNPSPMECTILKDKFAISAGEATSSGVQLKATADFYGPNGNSFGKGVDCTTRVAWKSSDDSQATVSNYLGSAGTNNDSPGRAGYVTWHPPLDGSPMTPVTISWKLLGTYFNTPPDLGYFGASITLTPPADARPFGSKLVLVPTNQIYNVGSQPLTVPFHLLVYYKDGRVVDASQETGTEWKVLTSNGTELNSSTTAGFGVNPGSAKNELLLTNQVPDSNLTISVGYSGTWYTSSTNGQIVVNASP